jgi:hypothetical protein
MLASDRQAKKQHTSPIRNGLGIRDMILYYGAIAVPLCHLMLMLVAGRPARSRRTSRHRNGLHALGTQYQSTPPIAEQLCP